MPEVPADRPFLWRPRQVRQAPEFPASDASSGTAKTCRCPAEAPAPPPETAGETPALYRWYCKAVIGILSGLVLEYVYTHILKKQEPDVDIHEICEEERCHCEHGVISSAAFHTLKVFVYIFLISLALNIIIGLVGEETLAGLFTGTPIAGELIAALVGLIPNCASSVVITQLYLDHIIGAGAMMAGLLVNAGVGLLILFRLNRDRVQNLKIVGVLYGLGVFWGIIIEFAGIVF